MTGQDTSDRIDAMGWSWSRDEAPGKSNTIRKARWLVRCAAALIGVACLAFVAGFLVFVHAVNRKPWTSAEKADGIVVLTGGPQRINEASELLAKGYGARLLITGVNEKTSRDKLQRLNQGEKRLFDCCVDLDHRALNTIGNAIETRRWMQKNGFSSVIVVTSNYHMPRTLVELGHALQGLRILPYPVLSPNVDTQDWWKDPEVFKLLSAEYVKFLIVWTRTCFEDDPEWSAAADMLSGGAPTKVVIEPSPR